MEITCANSRLEARGSRLEALGSKILWARSSSTTERKLVPKLLVDFVRLEVQLFSLNMGQQFWLVQKSLGWFFRLVTQQLKMRNGFIESIQNYFRG